MDTSRRFRDVPRGYTGTHRLTFKRCCCIQLRTATIVIAAIEMILIGLGLLVVIVYLGSGFDSATPTSRRVMVILSGFVQFLVACLLLHGARKHVKALIQAWLAVRCVTLALEVMLAMVGMGIDHQYDVMGILLGIGVVMLANILVVRSYMHSMDERSDSDPEAPTPKDLPIQEVSSVHVSHDISKAIVPIHEHKGVVTRF